MPSCATRSAALAKMTAQAGALARCGQTHWRRGWRCRWRGRDTVSSIGEEDCAAWGLARARAKAVVTVRAMVLVIMRVRVDGDGEDAGREHGVLRREGVILLVVRVLMRHSETDDVDD